MISRILRVAVALLLCSPVLPVSSVWAGSVAFLDLNIEGELPDGLSRSSFYDSGAADFKAVRDDAYILIDVIPRDEVRASWQLAFLVPNDQRVGATVLSSTTNAATESAYGQSEQIRCTSIPLTDESPSGWTFLHELIETSDSVDSGSGVESIAFSFELTCGDPSDNSLATTRIRGSLGFDQNPRTVTLSLPTGMSPAAALPAVTKQPAESRVSASKKPIEHVWISTGQLVELRFGFRPKSTDTDNHALKVVALTELPEAAQMLDNLGGGQSMFWVPTGNDIGTTTLQFQTFNTQSSEFLGNAKVVIEVLPGDVSSLSLNALPDIQFDRAVVKDGMARVLIGETLELVVYAKDRNSQAPLLNLKNAPQGATTLQVSEGEGRILWTPTAADEGYSNITVIAVDAEDKQRFSQKTMNVEVLASGRAQPAPVFNPFATVPLQLSGPSENRPGNSYEANDLLPADNRSFAEAGEE